MTENDQNEPVFGSMDPFREEESVSPPTPPRSQIEETPVEESVITPIEDDEPLYIPGSEEPVEEKKEEVIQRSKEELVSDVLGDNSPQEDEKETHAKVDVSHDPYKEMNYDAWMKLLDKRREGDITLPTMTPREFQKLVEAIPNSYYDDSEEGNRIFSLLRNMYTMMPRNKLYQSTVDDENRHFVQEVSHKGKFLHPATPKFKDIKPSGEMAVIRLNALTGRGAPLSIPLWHSGFWVTLKAPSDQKLIDLEYAILSAKILLGRNLVGGVFSNDQVYLAQEVINVFKDAIFSTTLHSDAGNILDYIKIQDLQQIAWGLASVIYPNGYPYSRVVYKTSEEGTPDLTVAHGLVDLSKLSFFDLSVLSEKQKDHMTRRQGPHMSKEAVKAYQEGFTFETERRVEIMDSIYFTLYSPSMTTYLNAGQTWVETCIQSVNQLLSKEDQEDEKEMNEMVSKYFKSSVLMQYKHFIKNIVFVAEGKEEEIYDDQASIDKIIESYSNDNEIIEKVLTEIRQFIDDTAVSVIGTVTTSDDPKQTDRFPNIVQLDALYTFFMLAVRRAGMINSRSMNL